MPGCNIQYLFIQDCSRGNGVEGGSGIKSSVGNAIACALLLCMTEYLSDVFISRLPIVPSVYVPVCVYVCALVCVLV